jgi:hypothetical protein
MKRRFTLPHPLTTGCGPSRQFTRRINSAAIGGIADMSSKLVAHPGDANDPKPT